MTQNDLIEFRKRFKLKKTTAAIALGCSTRTIYNYEVNNVPIPKYIALAASAFAMGLPPYGDKIPTESLTKR
jgi:DNA-binding XRE family transcriptional regulator